MIKILTQRIQVGLVSAVFFSLLLGPLSAAGRNNLSLPESGRHFMGTSVFILSSLIPGDNTYFYSLDYGKEWNSKNEWSLGANIYQFTAPMSISWDDESAYPGHVLSYGIVLAGQHYIWKRFFINQMINPLLMDYHSDATGNKISRGFMLLCATRTGYRFEFGSGNHTFYLEPGFEVSYWPVNTRVPAGFRALDNEYPSYVPSPSLQCGVYF